MQDRGSSPPNPFARRIRRELGWFALCVLLGIVAALVLWWLHRDAARLYLAIGFVPALYLVTLMARKRPPRGRTARAFSPDSDESDTEWK
ncbi:MAG: hypothetical protein D6E12_08480 [Desulfovibrio sp.]|nr:MAG: hypothetical protein D6E12_08480 [Desulfovibrio sp.]